MIEEKIDSTEKVDIVSEEKVELSTKDDYLTFLEKVHSKQILSDEDFDKLSSAFIDRKKFTEEHKIDISSSTISNIIFFIKDNTISEELGKVLVEQLNIGLSEDDQKQNIDLFEEALKYKQTLVDMGAFSNSDTEEVIKPEDFESPAEENILTDAISDLTSNKEINDIMNKSSEELSDSELKSFLFGKNKDEKVKIEDMNQMLSNMKNLISSVEMMWKSYQSMYHIDDDMLKKLTEFNLANRVEPTEEDKKNNTKFDSFNGLDKLTEEDVISIFGADNDIISENDHTETVKTIKAVIDTFYAWINSSREFRSAYDQYMDLIEKNELDKMAELKEIAEKEEDQEKKAKILEAYDLFFKIKYLDFLRDPVDESQMKYVIGAYTNEDKIKYQIERGKEKLQKLGFSSMFVLEMSKFEDRFLNEKYKKQSNILLAHFLNMIVYGDLKNSKSLDRSQAIAFVIALDRIARNCWKPEIRDRIIGNIEALEEQYLEPVQLALDDLKKHKDDLAKQQLKNSEEK